MRIQQWQQNDAKGEMRGGYGEDIRTFVFQKEQTHQSLLLDIKMSLFEETVDLSALFEQYCPLKNYKVSIYSPEVNAFLPLSKLGAENTGRVPAALLETQIIMVRFKLKEEDTQNTQSDRSDSGLESGLQEGKQKKDRSKQRTIGESIQLVKQWRALHLSSIKSGMKKMSLLEAARIIGVSKKTLDDYYYQLRLGEFYNFDFPNNLNEKVGILRAYVKQFKPSREQRNKNLRHPKNLKVIESFVDVPNILKQGLSQVESPMLEELVSPPFKSLSLQEESFESYQSRCNPFLNDVLSSYEDKFFKNFEFMLDDPNDPFIEISHNFKKKTVQDSSNDFFFF